MGSNDQGDMQMIQCLGLPRRRLALVLEVHKWDRQKEAAAARQGDVLMASFMAK